jgi:hypothetical protein
LDGNINIKKANIGGINDIKYPTRNNQESLADSIHFDINVMIKRGNAIINTIGAINETSRDYKRL